MVLVINEYTGMSAEKPRKEIFVSAPLELGGIVAGHGSVAYCIADGTVAVFDEEEQAWIDKDGEYCPMNLTDALFSLVKKPSSLTEMLFYKKIMGDGGGGGLPEGYVEFKGFSMDNDCYFKITDFYLTGADTLKFSFGITATCNVIGSYSGSASGNNYSLYATTTSTGKYLRYKSGAYNSYADTGKVYNVVISPTGTQGMETDSTWSQQDFTCTEEFYIGTTSPTSSSAKLKGALFGNIEVVGRLKLIPCGRIADRAVGYYDTVNGVFYEPAVGTPTPIE